MTPTPKASSTPIETDDPTGIPFDVSITYEATRGANGQVTVTAVSNLPDGAELMTSLRSDAGYQGQTKAFLDNGQATFGPYSDDGAGLLPGNYALSISMSKASLQSTSVRKHIGEDGEFMTGSLVQTSTIDDGVYVSLDSVLTIG